MRLGRRQRSNIILVINPGKEQQSDQALAAYKEKPYLVATEINYPYEGASTKKYLDMPKKGATGTFSVYYPAPKGYGNAKGDCCNTLSTAKLDYRARWDFYVPPLEKNTNPDPSTSSPPTAPIYLSSPCKTVACATIPISETALL